MKTCGLCHHRYPDSIDFCFRDGTPLSVVAGGGAPGPKTQAALPALSDEKHDGDSTLIFTAGDPAASDEDLLLADEGETFSSAATRPFPVDAPDLPLVSPSNQFDAPEPGFGIMLEDDGEEPPDQADPERIEAAPGPRTPFASVLPPLSPTDAPDVDPDSPISFEQPPVREPRRPHRRTGAASSGLQSQDALPEEMPTDEDVELPSAQPEIDISVSPTRALPPKPDAMPFGVLHPRAEALDPSAEAEDDSGFGPPPAARVVPAQHTSRRWTAYLLLGSVSAVALISLIWVLRGETSRGRNLDTPPVTASLADNMVGGPTPVQPPLPKDMGTHDSVGPQPGEPTPPSAAIPAAPGDGPEQPVTELATTPATKPAPADKPKTATPATSTKPAPAATGTATAPVTPTSTAALGRPDDTIRSDSDTPSATGSASDASAPSVATAGASTTGSATTAPPAHENGALTISSIPLGAKIYMDGVKIGLTPLRSKAIPIGNHILRLEMKGHAPESRIIEVAADEELQLGIVQLSASAPRNGLVVLSLKGAPEGTKVFVDDMYVGELPEAYAQLNEGSHNFRVVAPDGMNYSIIREVEFPADERPLPLDLSER